jgi:uncharacterized protein (TIGR02594 family)
MQQIIDVPSNVQAFAIPLSEAGVKTVIRYYNRSNSSRLPTKCLTQPELAALHSAGLSVAVVFEQGGGANGDLGDLSDANGTADAQRALELARMMDQPEGSGIYFAVDSDYTTQADLDQIASYFGKIEEVVGGRYRIGVYGSGLVSSRLKTLGLVDFIWLAGAARWSGTQKALTAGNWSIFQKFLDVRSEVGGFDCDGNIINPSFESFGQFGAGEVHSTPRGEGSAALFQVTARSGLNLRSGPGEDFRVLQVLDSGMIVTGVERAGSWIKVDLEGDGHADGFVFAKFLQAVSGGLPVPLPIVPSAAQPAAPPPGVITVTQRPIDIARQELAEGVAEIPGREDNPRIVMYHRTTEGGAAHDETAWCSSFVNYCVEQTGLEGTNSKAARSWHDQHWGRDVRSAPVEGDIVVFSRHSPTEDGGHVGFYIADEGDQIRILGGNQHNRISIGLYPKNGSLGSTRYKLLSIRRG